MREHTQRHIVCMWYYLFKYKPLGLSYVQKKEYNKNYLHASFAMKHVWGGAVCSSPAHWWRLLVPGGLSSTLVTFASTPKTNRQQKGIRTSSQNNWLWIATPPLGNCHAPRPDGGPPMALNVEGPDGWGRGQRPTPVPNTRRRVRVKICWNALFHAGNDQGPSHMSPKGPRRQESQAGWTFGPGWPSSRGGGAMVVNELRNCGTGLWHLNWAKKEDSQHEIKKMWNNK